MITGILIGDGLCRKNRWQVADFRGKALLKHPLEAMQNSNLDRILLILGRDYHLILNKLKIDPSRTHVILNHRYDRGLSTYLRSSLYSIPTESEAVIVASGSYPLLTSSLINDLISAFRKNPGGILAPSYEGKIGQPVIFDKRYLKNLMRLRGKDLGESIIFNNRQDFADFPVDTPDVIRSIEEIEELGNLESKEIKIPREIADAEVDPVDEADENLQEEVEDDFHKQVNLTLPDEMSEDFSYDVLKNFPDDVSGDEVAKATVIMDALEDMVSASSGEGVDEKSLRARKISLISSAKPSLDSGDSLPLGFDKAEAYNLEEKTALDKGDSVVRVKVDFSSKMDDNITDDKPHKNSQGDYSDEDEILVKSSKSHAKTQIKKQKKGGKK